MTASKGLCDEINRLVSTFEVRTLKSPLKILPFKRPNQIAPTCLNTGRGNRGLQEGLDQVPRPATVCSSRGSKKAGRPPSERAC